MIGSGRFQDEVSYVKIAILGPDGSKTTTNVSKQDFCKALAAQAQEGTIVSLSNESHDVVPNVPPNTALPNTAIPNTALPTTPLPTTSPSDTLPPIDIKSIVLNVCASLGIIALASIFFATIAKNMSEETQGVGGHPKVKTSAEIRDAIAEAIVKAEFERTAKPPKGKEYLRAIKETSNQLKNPATLLNRGDIALVTGHPDDIADAEHDQREYLRKFISPPESIQPDLIDDTYGPIDEDLIPAPGKRGDANVPEHQLPEN